MRIVFRWLTSVVFCVLFAFCAVESRARGSGLNVVIVVNQDSTNSVQLGNYYAERRQVPPQNILRINWPGDPIDWGDSEFASYLYNPLVSMLSARKLTNQIDYIVLSMDIPYRVTPASGKPNSTTSALFYGFKQDNGSESACSMSATSTNLYAGSENIFRLTPPTSANSNSWLVTMITHSNLALAKQIVDSGASADSTFPTQTVYLAKSIDTGRNVRYVTFDNAVFNTRLRGNYSMQRTNTSYNWVFGNCLGVQQGVTLSSVADTTFVPGSMADNLTSFGGQLFEDGSGQLKLFQYLTAGAAGSYGTVTEPCNYLEKFPSPQNYFYQARGFTLGECYYQSLTNPYQGVLVGEPLAAPFAQPADGSWVGLATNALLSGSTNLALQLHGFDNNHPVQRVDLFLDGLWMQTLTNIVPAQGNLLTVTINGNPVNYPVPSNATVKSVTAGLTTALNNISNVSKVAAFAHGDRIELQSFDQTKAGAQVSLLTSNSTGSAASATTWITSNRTNLLDTIASGIRNVQITGNAILGSFLAATITKTNGSQYFFGTTNTSGTVTLTDMASQLIAQINSSPDLSGSDGLSGQDLVTDAVNPVQQAEFNLVANGIGWGAAGIQATVFGTFSVSPAGNVRLDENLPDLKPRAHLYINAGVSNWTLPFALNTSALADGFHELTAAVFEGSHVQAQKRLAQNVLVQNGSLSASFISLVGETNAALESSLQFSVVANNNNISRIELFSTGGSVGVTNGQSSATFSVPATNLNIGLHPFYAVITANNGAVYRTETKWLRIIGENPPLSLTLTTPPPVLTWAAVPGRSYEVLISSNLSSPFLVQSTVVATNSLASWADTNSSVLQRFYRVRTSN
jgi:uncharacterized protein (TIGR03790 family)